MRKAEVPLSNSICDWHFLRQVPAGDVGRLMKSYLAAIPNTSNLDSAGVIPSVKRLWSGISPIVKRPTSINKAGCISDQNLQGK